MTFNFNYRPDLLVAVGAVSEAKRRMSDPKALLVPYFRRLRFPDLQHCQEESGCDSQTDQGYFSRQSSHVAAH
jgi:hypothetical protein